MNLNFNQYLPSMSSLPYGVREVVDKVTNVVMNYTDVEVKVLNATNDDNWGPHGKAMQEIADLTLSSSSFTEIMGIVWKRLSVNSATNHPRRIYKTLSLLIYLLKNGSPKVIHEINDHLGAIKYIRTLYSMDSNKHSPNFANVCLKIDQLLQVISDEDSLMIQRRENTKKQKSTASSRTIQAKSQSSNLSEFNFEGKWRSTTPGIMDKIADITDKVKDFVFDVGAVADDSTSSSSDGSDHDDDERGEGRNRVHIALTTDGTRAKVSDSESDEFADFQQAEVPSVSKLSAANSSFLFEPTESNSLIKLDDDDDDDVKTINPVERVNDQLLDLFATGVKNDEQAKNEIYQLGDCLNFDHLPQSPTGLQNTFLSGLNDSKIANQPSNISSLLSDLMFTVDQDNNNPRAVINSQNISAASADSIIELEQRITNDLANFTLDIPSGTKRIGERTYKPMNSGI
ncbi:hypothetical protein ACOME3_010309 [Neoechinorhynchus agilis]